MQRDSFKGRDFISNINKGRSTDQDYPYQFIIASEYVYPNMSKDELLDLADFIKEFVENN
jgi:hypothetical protein